MQKPPHSGWTLRQALGTAIPSADCANGMEGRFEALKRFLLDGRLVAYGRFAAKPDKFQYMSEAWWKDFSPAKVFERKDSRVAPRGLLDVKIYPALVAPQIHFLPAGGLSLRTVLDRFLWNDPEVIAREERVSGSGSIEEDVRFRKSPELRGLWTVRMTYLPNRSIKLLRPLPLEDSVAGRYHDHQQALLFRFYRLVELLRSGLLIAKGEPIRDIEPAEVPLAVWDHKNTYLHIHSGDVYMQREGTFVLRWQANMLVPSANIAYDNGLFSSEICESIKPTIGAETECRRLLVAAMKKSPSAKIQNKRFWEEKLLREIEGLTKRAFARSWGNAIEETGATKWRDAGAPPRRGSLKQPLG